MNEEKYSPSPLTLKPNENLPIILTQKIKDLLKKKSKVMIAVDGRCCSGKTTLAKKLQYNFDSYVIHMDDFFLPFEKRTKERLSEIGGNVHYERVNEEVLYPLHQNRTEEVYYKPYNCQTRSFSSPRRIPVKSLYIVEGVYSMHPTLLEFYDLTIYLSVKHEVQLKRLRKRNPKQFNLFINKWIPLEEKYFKERNLKNLSDFVIETTNAF